MVTWTWSTVFWCMDTIRLPLTRFQQTAIIRVWWLREAENGCLKEFPGGAPWQDIRVEITVLRVDEEDPALRFDYDSGRSGVRYDTPDYQFSEHQAAGVCLGSDKVFFVLTTQNKSADVTQYTDFTNTVIPFIPIQIKPVCVSFVAPFRKVLHSLPLILTKFEKCPTKLHADLLHQSSCKSDRKYGT